MMVLPQHFRRSLWACFFALVLLQPVWYLLWVPPRIPTMYALSIALLPLLPALILLALRQRLAIVAAGVGVLLHFTFAAMEAVMYGANTKPAVLQCFLCSAFFFCWYLAMTGEKRAKRHNVLAAKE